MTDVRRRGSDSDWDDSYRQREDPTELRLGWNGKSIRARGLGVIVALAVAAILTGMWYFSSSIATAMSREHLSLKVSQDRTSCIITMTASERETFRNHYQPGAFKQMCPWVDE